MTLEPDFTHPSAEIATARARLARLQVHLDLVLDPLDEITVATDLALAMLTLEDVRPPYAPFLEEPPPSADPRGDLLTAVTALVEASGAATTAREKLRLACVIRDLRDLARSPYLDNAVVDRRGGRA